MTIFANGRKVQTEAQVAEHRSRRVVKTAHDAKRGQPDRRFDAWLAGATPEQAAKWKAEQEKREQPPGFDELVESF